MSITNIILWNRMESEKEKVSDNYGSFTVRLTRVQIRALSGLGNSRELLLSSICKLGMLVSVCQGVGWYDGWDMRQMTSKSWRDNVSAAQRVPTKWQLKHKFRAVFLVEALEYKSSSNTNCSNMNYSCLFKRLTFLFQYTVNVIIWIVMGVLT